MATSDSVADGRRLTTRMGVSGLGKGVRERPETIPSGSIRDAAKAAATGDDA
jgi:hypothetical protein